MKGEFSDYPIPPLEDEYTLSSSFTGPCGDTVEFYIKLDGTKIEKIWFSSRGCINTRVCAMAACKLSQGRDIDSLASISASDIEKEVGGLPPEGKHCACLVETALKLSLESLKLNLPGK